MREQVSDLLNVPDPDTLKGRRDRAMLALLIGCGLRRAELLRLNVEDVQQREGWWVIPDLCGKGNRLRTVPFRPRSGRASTTGPMLAFKIFESAVVTIGGVELLRGIHKNQFALSRLGIKAKLRHDIWNAVLAAQNTSSLLPFRM